MYPPWVLLIGITSGMMNGRWGPLRPIGDWLQAAVARHNANNGRRLRYR